MIFRFFIILYKICFIWGVISKIIHFEHTTIFAQSINLAWTESDSPNLSHNNVYRSTHLDSSFVLIGTVTHPDTSYVDDDIQWGLNYYYVATVVDLFGNESAYRREDRGQGRINGFFF